MDSLEPVLRTPPRSLLRLPSASLEEITDSLRAVPFDGAMQALALLARELDLHPLDRGRQLRLIRRFFRPPLSSLLAAFVVADDHHVAFDRRMVSALQRLLIVHAAPDRTTSDERVNAPGSAGRGPIVVRAVLDESELAVLSVALLALPHALDTHASLSVGSVETPLEVEVRRLLQLSVWYASHDIVSGVARVWDSYLGDNDDLGQKLDVPIDRWLREDYAGLGVREQLAAAFAFGLRTGGLVPSGEGDDTQKVLLPEELEASKLAAHLTDARRLLSATRAEFSTTLTSGGNEVATVAWNHVALEARPFLERTDRSLLLLSPRDLAGWLTRGFHYRLLDAGNRRQDDLGRPLGPRVLTLAGRLGERFAHRLIDRSLDDAARAGQVRVHREQEYRIGKRRLDTPDVMLQVQQHVVAVEVYSGRVSLAARVGNDPDATRRALWQVLVSKGKELAARIEDFLGGTFALTGLSAADVQRVWPVLVLTGDSVLPTVPLWEHLADALPELSTPNGRIGRICICSMSDLEALLALVERGEHLPTLLSRFAESEQRYFAPRDWALLQSQQHLDYPRYIREQFDDALDWIGRYLDSVDT